MHQIAFGNIDSTMVDSAKSLNNIGIDYFSIGDYKNSKDYLEKALELRQKIFNGTNHISIAHSYNNLALINSRRMQFDTALYLYSKAKEIYNHIEGSEVWIANLNSNIGWLYYQKGDFKFGEQYFTQSLNILKNINTKEATARKAASYNRLGIIYDESSNFGKAIESYQKGIRLYTTTDANNTLFFLLNNRGDTYVKLKNYPKALAAYQKALTILDRMNENNTNKMAWILQRLALLHAKQNNKELALEYLNKSHKILKQLILDETLLQSSHLKTGTIYHELNHYDSALFYFQSALFISSHSTFKDIYETPQKEDIGNPYVAISYLKAKAECLLDWYDETPKTDILVAAYKSLKLATELIDISRNGFVSIESKYILAENEIPIYEMGIECSYLLHQSTNNDFYIEGAFYFAEKSKSSVLLSVLQDNKAKSFSNIPEKLLLKEQNLKKEITFYKEHIYEEKLSVNPDTNKIILWEDYLLTYTEEQTKLKDHLEDKYPEYFKLKYNTTSPNISDIQKLVSNKNLILEYAFTSTDLYIFQIDKKSSSLSKLEYDSTLSQNIHSYIDQIRNMSFTTQSETSQKKLSDISYVLYQLIIEPYLKKGNCDQLTIIPDGILSYLPFESLYTKAAGSESYNHAPYLIRNHLITYSYSSSLLKESWNGSKRKIFNKVLSVAPKYAPIDKNLLMTTRSGQINYRDNLRPLPFAKREAKLIETLTKGESIMEEMATEKKFAKTANRYDILHLAMHTIIDDNNPLFSKLVFYCDDYTKNDGFLTTGEIFGLDLNASMTVLSSCSSGDGGYSKGEGVLSLARGFFYAGCPSLVMTLWQVEDESGLKLMQYYYKYLLQGQSKPKAMQKAKLKYLESVPNEKRHPFYWSAYICIGNPTAVYFSKRVILLIGIAIITFILVMRNRLSKTKNKVILTDPEI